MVSMLAYPKSLVDKAAGAVLTFVVPSTNGCGMRCPHCYIRQRKETATTPILTPRDYEKFIEDIHSERTVSCVSIQGVEPLSLDSIDYTDSILKKATELAIPSAIVTNGASLKKVWMTLAKHSLNELTISLDADNPEDHDAIRGVPGTFDKVIEGIKAASIHPNLSKALSIGSVLLPGKGYVLEKMPELLHELGIKNWFVTPVIRIDSKGGKPVEKFSAIASTLRRLNKLAKKLEVQMVVEDEFNHYDSERHVYEEAKELIFRNLDNPHGLIRLQPSGICEIGRQLLKEHNKESPKWVPGKENVVSFYRRVMSHCNYINAINI